MNLREPLTLYFSNDKNSLLAELKEAYLHPLHGPQELPVEKQKTSATETKGILPGLLVPHGAMCDAGPITAWGYNALGKYLPLRSSVIVFLLGTNHRGSGATPVAMSSRDWKTPLGIVQTDQTSIKFLQFMFGFDIDELPHSQEHSIENQLPFLQHLASSCSLEDLRIVPISIGWLGSMASARRVAKALAGAAKEACSRNFFVSFIGTTDYSHAGSGYGEIPPPEIPLSDYVKMKDRPILEAIKEGTSSEDILKSWKQCSCSMCGLWPAIVMTELSLLFPTGMRKGKPILLKYALSSDVLARTNICGFASFFFK